MPLSKDVKDQIIAEYATHEGDTGSPEVQIALLTRRIKDLTEHFKTHTHDSVTVRSSSVSACVADFGPARLP